jgi:hypothetical protein
MLLGVASIFTLELLLGIMVIAVHRNFSGMPSQARPPLAEDAQLLQNNGDTRNHLSDGRAASQPDIIGERHPLTLRLYPQSNIRVRDGIRLVARVFFSAHFIS